MAQALPKTLWTIGHSTRQLDHFIDMLRSFLIEVLADVRNYPGSRRYPHFNKEALEVSLPANEITYYHFKDLGGRRKPNPNSKNTSWNHTAFRGYADYMETDAFKTSIAELEDIASEKRTVIMCSEAVWWRCHRSLISDYFKAGDWRVMHIMDHSKEVEHAYTKPARIVGGRLTYTQEDLL